MKKLVFIFLILAFTLGIFAGCNGQSAASTGTTGSTSSTTLPSTFSSSETTSTTASTVPPTSSTQPLPPETTSMRIVAETGLYEVPASDGEMCIQLAPGDHVEVLEMGEEWASVLLDGHTYYIPSNHLRQEGRYLVVIDAGHQRRGNLELEPNGPGSTTMKYKVSYGTQGSFTGLPEYELTLMVSLKLQTILEARGYDVVMVRTTHDVDISNAERAMIANELYADIFIRIHANGSDNPAHNGIMTLCQASNNPYNSHLYEESRALSYAVLDEMVAITGASRQYVWETNTMSGINWCQVPVTIVEMGYMTNETEDYLMTTDEYQQKLAEGMANGIDAYIAQSNS